MGASILPEYEEKVLEIMKKERGKAWRPEEIQSQLGGIVPLSTLLEIIWQLIDENRIVLTEDRRIQVA